MRFDDQTIVVFDMEWTTWPGFWASGFNMPGKRCEVVQIGAVRLDVAEGFRERAAFQALVRPVFHPELSDYFVELTGITQAMVEAGGVPFADALAEFIAFVGEDAGLYCFGTDARTLEDNCDFHGLPRPPALARDRDLRAMFADFLGVPATELMSSRLPARVGIENPERAHDALGDARALALVLRHLWREGRIAPPAAV